MPTIEVPTPSAELLVSLENVTIEANTNEVAAVAALREKFAVYAKHNGFIRIARHQTYKNGGVPLNDDDWFLGKDGSPVFEDQGSRLKGLLASNNFTQPNDTEFTGPNVGYRVYLTERGEWVKITREGKWSQWQGAPQWWTCGVDLGGEYGDGESYCGGHIETLTDEQVAAECDFAELLRDLGSSMAEMCKKLPDRFNRLKVRAELAQRTIEALK